MKVEVNQKEFYQAIQTVKKAVSTKTTLPILSGILLRTQGNTLKLVGTDLEIGIECFVDATVTTEGDIVLPAKYLASIIRELPNEKVILATEPSNNTSQIKCDNSQFNIHGSAADEFPLLPEIESNTKFSISQQKLKKIINQIEFAVSEDENKPFLTGGLLILNDQKVELVATDTYRLAYREDEISQETSATEKAIIPNKTLTELSKLLDKSADEVEIVITENQILFTFAGISIVSRLIEGQFPNYQQVIPNQTKTQVEVDKNTLLQATKRAALLAKKESNIIKINFESNRLIITSNAPEIGQAYEEVPVSLTGPESEIAFNASYLMDCLKEIDKEKVIIELSGALAPGVIKTNSEQKYIYVIMPVRSA
ncbi:DNA polymerase III, beta subunit [Halobacteroides halobius DSM 5150]|uniref:Beta sliding clamp n=1 Tax=Halobacteroides halobius (strain ATCC 35273 / DSM 5150 / MD-1) TaxID=748449 RepID=L0K679_HALHC|nr:DNA polymerase III subunit beta [Halobacteroides halobius]AGB40040.1 DNA polymerase III, beta subunit [Halobacteroides halobius DSM 5150]